MVKSSYIFIVFIILAFGVFSCEQKQEPQGKQQVVEETSDGAGLLISHISDQWTYEGTRINFFVHLIHQQLDDVVFSIENAPKFIQVKTNKGQAEITVDAPLGSSGNYSLLLEIKKGTKKTTKTIHLTIKKAPLNVYYLDEEQGNDENDGSISNPWKSLRSLEKLAKKETPNLVIFKSNKQGKVHCEGIYKEKVYLMPIVGKEVNMEQITFSNAQNITLKGFTINGNDLDKSDSFILIDSLSSQIEIANCKIGNSRIAGDWTFEEWRNKNRNGVFSYGDNILIFNNFISYTLHGMETNGNFNEVSFNIVDRFAGDAIRNTGDNNIFSFNTMKNATIGDYKDPKGNHDDLFQSWTFGKPIENVILSNNIAVAYADSDLKHSSNVVQGLVCFDGFVKNWIIKDNLVLIDHPHGIALLGANECQIENNIVSRNPLKYQSFESEPWIMVEKHKDGRKGKANTVRNNIVPVLKIGEGEAFVKDNIVTDTSYTSFFWAFSEWDFRLK